MSDNRVQNGNGGSSGGHGGFWGFLNNVAGLTAGVLGTYFGRDREGSQRQVEYQAAGIGIDPGLAKLLILATMLMIVLAFFRGMKK